MCIIRGKPITARNACQAVKCYPGPQPGGLMISWGIHGVFSAHLYPSPPPPPLALLPSSPFFSSSSSIHDGAGRIIIALIVTSPRDTTSSPCHAADATYHSASRLSVPPDYRDNLRERQRLSAADMKSLLRHTARDTRMLSLAISISLVIEPWKLSRSALYR